MAASFEVGSRVKIEIDDLPYAGTIITYDTVDNDTVYKVSVDGIGNVLSLTDDDIKGSL